jgi:hypothetical protein
MDLLEYMTVEAEEIPWHDLYEWTRTHPQRSFFDDLVLDVHVEQREFDHRWKNGEYRCWVLGGSILAVVEQRRLSLFWEEGYLVKKQPMSYESLYSLNVDGERTES